MAHRWLLASAVPVIVVGLLAGCGGGGSSVIFLNVRERPSWGDKRIAVAALGGDGNLYIWSVSEKGGGAVLLTPAPADEEQPAGGKHPAFSPDFSKIAFAGRRDGSQAIWALDVTNPANLTQITEDDVSIVGPGADQQPCWHPSGTKILFASNRDSGNFDIYEQVIGGAKRLIFSSDNDDIWPCYNPADPQWIVFEQRISGGPHPVSHIYVWNVGWTLGVDSPVLLVGSTTDEFSDGAPCWSPDGTKIVFHSNRAGDWDIWVIDVSGIDFNAPPATMPAPVQLTRTADADGYPVWKPDGSRIAFIRANELWTMNPDGSDQRRITRAYR